MPHYLRDRRERVFMLLDPAFVVRQKEICADDQTLVTCASRKTATSPAFRDIVPPNRTFPIPPAPRAPRGSTNDSDVVMDAIAPAFLSSIGSDNFHYGGGIDSSVSLTALRYTTSGHCG